MPLSTLLQTVSSVWKLYIFGSSGIKVLYLDFGISEYKHCKNQIKNEKVFRSIAWKYFATGFARVLMVLVHSVMTHSQLGLSRHQKGRRPQLAPQNTQVFVPKIKQLSRAEAITLSFVLSKSNRISWWMPLVHFGNWLVKRDDKGKENFLWSESSFCQHRGQGSRILGIDDALRKKKGRRW